MTVRHGQSWTAFLRTSVAVIAIVAGAEGRAVAQAQPPANQPVAASSEPTAVSSLRLEVVLSRLDATGKSLSRMPYLFSLSTPPRTGCRLRMGAKVPVATMPSGTSSPAPFEYRDVGTNIDCNVIQTADGRFQVSITIQETLVLSEDMIEPAATAKLANAPVFRSYESQNSVVLRDGETTRFTAAVDRVTAETVTAEVTLTVLK